MSDYISRQAAEDAMTQSVCGDTWEVEKAMEAVRQLPAADVVPVEILIAEIYKLKCQQDSKNQDYYTGYMSALSTVEGILAGMGEED